VSSCVAIDLTNLTHQTSIILLNIGLKFKLSKPTDIVAGMQEFVNPAYKGRILFKKSISSSTMHLNVAEL